MPAKASGWMCMFLIPILLRTGCRPAWPSTPTLEELLGLADYISVSVPLTASTRGLIGAAQLACCKKTAVLVNTARGGVVDEAALYEALAEGRLFGAACDVFEQEPPSCRKPAFFPSLFHRFAAYRSEHRRRR